MIWRKIFADVFGCRLRIPALLTEATSMGAALLGGVGTGVYSDFSMVEAMNPTSGFTDPAADLREIYQQKTQLFMRAYKGLADVFATLDKV
jgi:xylulokinase